MVSPPALFIDQLCHSYGNHRALQNLSLLVRPGEIVGLLGPNGAGKTTAMSVIAGLVPLQSGQVQLRGHNATQPQSRQSVGFLVGPPALWPQMSGRDHLIHTLNILQSSAAPPPQPQAPEGPWWNPDQLLQAVGLTLRDGKRPTRHYSQGMRQRLAIAIALAAKPQLAILDEPTNGLDPLGGPEIWDLLQRAANNGMAILVSTHLLQEVQRYCHRAPMLLQGQLLHPDVLALLNDPNRPETHQLTFLTKTQRDQAYQHLEQNPNPLTPQDLAPSQSDFSPPNNPITGNPNQQLPELTLNFHPISTKNETELLITTPRTQIPSILTHLASKSTTLPYKIQPQESTLEDLFRQLAKTPPQPQLS